MRRLLLAACLALVGAAPARADTLTYDTTTRVATITLTVAAPYVEIGANSGGDAFINDLNGFSSLPTGCSMSGTQYKCGNPAAPLTKTVVHGTPGPDTVIGLTHVNEALSNYNPPIQMDLGGGDDIVQGGDGPDVVNLGDGDDRFTGFLGNDTIDGGAGRDTLRAGKGADTISGGGGSDTLSYEDRTAGVTISLNGLADDGEAGEKDSVAGDIETILTGSGADHFTGDDGPNTINTGAGDDTVDPGGGVDFVDTGAGRDTVTARDGVTDRIDCGDDADSLAGDQLDSAVNCEDAQLTRDKQADVDNDGIAAPADCDDHDPARRPGFPDTPGNGIDEDCSGADATVTAVAAVAPVAPTRIAATVLSQFSTHKGRTKVLALTLLGVPAGATAELRCSGGTKRGCFKGVKRPSGTDLARLVKGKRFKRGAALEVRILAPGQIGTVIRYAARAGSKPPKASVRCLAPGATKPAAC